LYLLSIFNLSDKPSMRFDRLLPALFSLFTAASAQTLSGLTFDGRNEVSLIWAFDGQTTGRYDFYLCAGDESTGVYVSGTAINMREIPAEYKTN
jgi:hypothetical protein